MLNINRSMTGVKTQFALEGRLDTINAPKLEGELRTSVKGVETLIFDLSELVYISSTGLRVLLSAQKVMSRQGTMIIRNVRPNIMSIFEMTGFTDLTTIE